MSPDLPSDHLAPPSWWAARLSSSLQREVGRQNRAVVRRPLSAMRRLGVRLHDPSIRFELDGADLLLPLSHELPVIRAQYPHYSSNLGAVAEVVSRLRTGSTMVDIGANVGDSVAIVRARTPMPILCVEGDETFLPYLRHNISSLPDVEIEPHYVASSATTVAHAVVERSGGTARLVERAEGPTVETLTLADIVRRHPVFATPTLIKVDTDGHDAEILTAAIDVIAAHHPVLFFEHDPTMTRAVGGGDANMVFTELAAVGYNLFALYTNTGEPAATYGAGELPALVERCANLAPGSADGVAYFDVVAVHSLDGDLAEALSAQL